MMLMESATPGIGSLDVIRKKLYTAVISDILDQRGYRHQVLQPNIRAVGSHRELVGRAYPVLAAETFEMPAKPYFKLIEALDSIQEDEVFITNRLSDRAAFWGELLSNVCASHRAAGAIIDGLVRDLKRIEPLGFPVFGRGTSPIDSLGRFEVLASRQPIECGGVHIESGDLVIADWDGVVIVPKSIEDVVIAEALAKVRGENAVRDGIRQGRSLRELFDSYGVL
jgi:regulator of RNase E activity RraA